MRQAWVSVRLVRRRWQLTCALTAMVAVTTWAMASVLMLTSQVQAALDESVSLSQGGFRFAITGAQLDDSTKLRTAGYVPVRESVATDTAGDQVVALREVVDGGIPGRLLDGRLPRQPGEAVASPAMGLKPGHDTVSLATDHGHVEATVVGTVVDPVAPRSARVAVGVPSLEGQEGVMWLGNTQLDAVSTTSNADMQIAVVHEQFGDNNENPVAGVVANTRTIMWLIALGGFGLLTIILSTLRIRCERDVEALVASGATRGQSWRILHLAWGLAMVLGCAVGTLMFVLIFKASQGELSQTFGQVWSSGWADIFRIGVVAGTMAAPVVVGAPLLMSMVLASRSNGGVKRVRAKVPGLVVGLTAATSLVALGTIAVPMLGGHAPWLPASWAPAFGLFSLVGLPHAIRLLVLRGAGPVQRLTLVTLMQSGRRATLVIAPLLFAATLWATMAERTATDNEVSGDVARTALLQLVGVPDGRSEDLARVFQLVGGGAVETYAMTVPADGLEPLAVTRKTAECVQKAHGVNERRTCLETDPSPTTMVVGGKRPHAVLVPSMLGEGTSVGVVWTDEQGIPVRAAVAGGATTMSGEADAASVVLVGAESRTAELVRKNTSSSAFQTMQGYLTLEQSDAATLRSYLYTSAPTAFVQTSVTSKEYVLVAMARTVAMASGFLFVLLLMLVAAAQARVSLRTRAILGSFSTARSSRALRRSMWIPAALVSIGVPALAALAAWCALPHTGAGIGLVWLAGPVFYAIAVVVQFVVNRIGQKLQLDQEVY